MSPGCSPTSMIWACCGPSPNTVWVASFQSGQARQSAASSRRVSMLSADADLRFHRRLRPFLRFVRFGGGIGDHGAGRASGAGDQRFNQRGLRQVPPIFLRHLGLHRLHLEPGRIEDAGVIAPPGFLQPVLGRRLGLADAWRERDGMAVPMRAEVGRQDRPGHVGEAAGEERRGQFDDMMLRLEPGDVMRVALAADFAEADEGMHLVLVAAHGLGHRRDQRDVGIGGDRQQIVMAAQPPQQAIQDRKPFGVAVQDRGSAPVRRIWPETLKVPCGARAACGGRRLRTIRARCLARVHVTSAGVTSFSTSAARRFAPAVEIGFAVEGDEVHDFLPRHCRAKREAIHLACARWIACVALAMTV